MSQGLLTFKVSRSALCRTPLDEWSARRTDLYLITYNTPKRQTSMLPTGFEPTISANERPQIDASDRASTVIGNTPPIIYENSRIFWKNECLHLVHKKSQIAPSLSINLVHIMQFSFVRLVIIKIFQIPSSLSNDLILVIQKLYYILHYICTVQIRSSTHIILDIIILIYIIMKRV